MQNQKSNAFVRVDLKGPGEDLDRLRVEKGSTQIVILCVASHFVRCRRFAPASAFGGLVFFGLPPSPEATADKKK